MPAFRYHFYTLIHADIQYVYLAPKQGKGQLKNMDGRLNELGRVRLNR